MKTILVSVLVAFTAFGSFGDITLTKREQKKIKKAIQKVWKGKEIKLSPLKVNLPEGKLTDGEYLSFVLNENSNRIGYAIVKQTKACRAGGCSTQEQAGSFSGNFEYFNFLLLLDSAMEVQRVEVINYQAQYGYEICSKRWLKQFKGFKGQPLNYGKDIQAISGATVSASAITDDVQLVYSTFATALEESSGK